MAKMNLVTMLVVILLGFGYMAFVQYSTVKNEMSAKSKINWLNIILLLGGAFLVRFIAAKLYYGYDVDMNCFTSWSDMVYKDGIDQFYKLDAFTDYPPGYMYILYVIGWLRATFPSLAASTILIKMPAILCDLATGFFLYKLAKKRFTESASLVLTSLYLLNPAIILNSSIWGQVDSVFTLTVVLMCYFVAEKKLPYAYFIFALGILLKPQTLIFTPVLIFGILDQVILKDFNIKNFFKQLGLGLLAIASMFLVISPFGISHVLKQYTETLGSYQYATVNGYNFWAALGKNWHAQTETLWGMSYNKWGTLFIVLTVIIAAVFFFASKKEKGKYFFTGAIIVCGMFLFSVRMHERYMFPALVLILLTYIYKPRKELILLFGLFTITHMNNVWHVLFYYKPDAFDWNDKEPIIIGVATLLTFAYMLYIAVRYFCFSNEEKTEEITQKEIMLLDMKPTLQTLRKSEVAAKITKFDIIAIIAISVIYGAIALYDLGDHQFPQTQWETTEYYTTLDFDFGDIKHITQMNYCLGNYENRKFKIQASNDLVTWVDVQDMEMVSVFSWGKTDFDVTARFLRLTSNSDRAVVREMVFKDSEGNVLLPVNAGDYAGLFDEQDLLPARSTFRDSTYFDEIYHARTAYEYTQGIYSYENTHPPLGKIFIALGMTLFGVNPFGWRIMGTLFGIAMLPVFYLFAKRFFKESWIATITTVLFAADFMHFAQTRIATIDVFVTFFVILMYYFMYRYYQLSFYDTKLTKTWVPLGLCGLAMGLGIACKWPGIYAGAGLAVIFFAIMFKRFMEYRYAKQNPDGVTNDIKHSEVIKKFLPSLIKTLLFCIIVFVIVPVLIYLAAYIPFKDGQDRGLIISLIENQKTMFNYHSSIEATHPFSSWWYEWPIISRPIWYYSGTVSETVKEGISSFGNPLVWWAGIPAFLYMVYLTFKEKDKKAFFLCLGYLAQYMPWFLVSRIVFIYHYFPSVAFITLMIGYTMFKLSTTRGGRNKKVWIRASIGYAAAAVILFAMFYPVLSGQPVEQSYVLSWLRWFKSWVLI